MVSLKNRSKGFTIVELLIVIVVIAILATLVIVTFTGIQQKARDSQRQTDINALDSHIEAYFASTGYYPSYADLSSGTWVSGNLKGLDPQALVDPKGGSIATGTGDATHYGYAVNTGGASPASCEADDTTCAAFTLTAHLEGGGTFTKASNT
ncbi:MAG TPA: type II secretion system protein [Candidatus Saccharimonadales bacterium]|nr:type II secretion system protein [Candidatus Saccharimonadales bacterium]